MKTYIGIALGKRIKNLREQANLTHQALADKVGVSRPAVSGWESGNTKNIKLDNLLSLAKVFNMTAQELLTGEQSHRDVAEEHKPSYASCASTNDETELLIKYRNLSDSDRTKLLKIIDVLARE